MDTTLILIGVGCIIGAIIGGGVKLVQIELSQVTSLWRQSLLGLFGVILVLSGLVAGGHLTLPAPAAPAGVTVAENSAPVADNPGPATPPPAAVGPIESAPIKSRPLPPAELADAVKPPPVASLPAKVDLFWCVTDDGGAENQALADRIAPALRETGRIGRVRARPLQQTTNARSDYSITRNIVRYDPGERPAADALARMATAAAGTDFAAAPALPGTPSVDYLSIFICAVH